MFEPTPPPIQDFRPAGSPGIPRYHHAKPRRSDRWSTMVDKVNRLPWPKRLMVIFTAIWALVISLFTLYLGLQCLRVGVDGTVTLAPVVVAMWMLWVLVVSVPYGVVMVMLMVANSVLPPKP